MNEWWLCLCRAGRDVSARSTNVSALLFLRGCAIAGCSGTFEASPIVYMGRLGLVPLTLSLVGCEPVGNSTAWGIVGLPICWSFYFLFFHEVGSTILIGPDPRACHLSASISTRLIMFLTAK
jgi:hypothetical protein